MAKNFIVFFETSAMVTLDTDKSVEELTDEERDTLIAKALNIVESPSAENCSDIIEN